MAGFNRVILMGRLTRDPELRHTPSQMAICAFSLAVSRRFKKNDDWVEEPTFIDCTIFGAKAEPFSRFHTKGKMAFIEGSLRLETWDDKTTGAKRSKIGVIVDNWEFTGEKGGDSRSEAPFPPNTIPMDAAAETPF
jgi:single-strand DNA-binding protein